MLPKYDSLKVEGEGYITENFSIKGDKMLPCPCCGKIFMTKGSRTHEYARQLFRTWLGDTYGMTMPVNSGCRCMAHHLRLYKGYSSDQIPMRSLHLKGEATDFDWHNKFEAMPKAMQFEVILAMKAKWKEICRDLGLQGGFGIYPSFYHLDSRIGNPRAALKQWGEFRGEELYYG